MTEQLQECLRIIQNTVDLAADIENNQIRFLDYDETGEPYLCTISEEEAEKIIDDIRSGP